MEAEERKRGIAAVFDRAAPTYDQVGVEFFGSVGAGLLARSRPVPGEHVLEVGCGRGVTAVPAARAVGSDGRVLATDLAPAMVAAVADAAAEMPWLTAEVRDAEHPPDGPWDLVQAGLVLFFLPDLSGAVRRYRATLAPEGRLAFSWFGDAADTWQPLFTALTADLPAELAAATRPAGEDSPFHGPDAMETFLVAQGFPDVRTETERLDVTLRDADQWWDWIWSQGQRFLLEALEERGLLDAARARVQPLLEELVRRDGALRWWTEVRWTVARPRRVRPS